MCNNYITKEVLMQTIDLIVIGSFLSFLIWFIVSWVKSSRLEKQAEDEAMLEYGSKEAQFYKEFTKKGVLIELVDGKKYVALFFSTTWNTGYYRNAFNANNIEKILNTCGMESNFRTLYEIPSWFKSDYRRILTTTRQIRKVDNLIINPDAVSTITLLANNVEALYYYYRQPKGYPSFKELLAELDSLGE
jgi:hypothetical protein